MDASSTEVKQDFKIYRTFCNLSNGIEKKIIMINLFRVIQITYIGWLCVYKLALTTK